MRTGIIYSKGNDDWTTPKDIFERFMSEGYIDLFPYKAEFNQYEIDYYNKKLFCNPPYSQMNYVADYIIRQIKNGNDITMLVPARTDTKWFHKLLEYDPKITFIKGRLRFGDGNNVATFPSIYITFERRINK